MSTQRTLRIPVDSILTSDIRIIYPIIVGSILIPIGIYFLFPELSIEVLAGFLLAGLAASLVIYSRIKSNTIKADLTYQRFVFPNGDNLSFDSVSTIRLISKQGKGNSQGTYTPVTVFVLQVIEKENLRKQNLHFSTNETKVREMAARIQSATGLPFEE